MKVRAGAVAATVCAIGVALMTVLGNVPINNQIKLWNPAAPPQNWAATADRWWRFQTVRTAAALLRFASVILASLRRREAKLHIVPVVS